MFPLPDWVQGIHLMPGKKLIAIGFDIFQEEISKDYRVNTVLLVFIKCPHHLVLILFVGGAFRNQDRMKRRPRLAACLSNNKRRTPCMLMRSYSRVMVVNKAAAR